MPSSPARLALTLLVLSAACDEGSGDDGDPTGCATGPTVVSELLTYTPDPGLVACQPARLPDLHVALSPERFAEAGACGACVEVTGSRGTALAQVVDQCPTCARDDLDASVALWTAVEDGPIGIATVTWHAVACPDDGPIRYRSCAATNPYFLCLVAEGHRFPLAALEVRPSGATELVALARDASNQWTRAFPTAIQGPFTVRATDTYGHALTDTFASLDAGTAVSGAADFPGTCP
jgi:expansin